MMTVDSGKAFVLDLSMTKIATAKVQVMRVGAGVSIG